jgi:serine phosphatase RsbU (regulator of sigma subunit)
VADEKERRRPVSLLWYLIGFLALIVGLVVASSLSISYFEAKQVIRQDYAILLENAGNNAVESAWLVNQGLELIDEDLNPPLNTSLHQFRNAYIGSKSDPSVLDLGKIRSEIAMAFSGEVNLYIFNEDGIIEYSTLPELVGVDFRNYPDFYRELTRIRLGSEFAADPVVRSVHNASDRSVNGTLRKFAYLPTPDHRYVLEVGVESEEFAGVRSRLSYQAMADRLYAVNPDLLGIRVYDFNGNVAASAGNPGDPNDHLAALATASRSGFTVIDEDRMTQTRYLFVDLRNPKAASDASVVIELCFGSERLETALARLVFQYSVIGICAILMGIILAFFLFRKLTGAIGAIVEDVGIVARGDLSHTIRSLDTAEFAQLEAEINLMIRKILAYTEELERKKAELQVAADIQQAFLPKTLPQIQGFDLAAVNIPAREVGGDFYDIFPVADGKHALVIADVAGKGVPASLFMALSRTAVRIVSRWERSARRVLEASNTIFIEDSGSPSFVTVFFALLDRKERVLTYVNAGHNPPLLLHADGTMEELEPTGPVIGLIDDPGYTESQIRLHCGDLLVMYTDGVTEAINSREEMFSDGRLRDIVRASAGLPALGIVLAIRDAVTTYCGSAPQFDDMTIIVVKVE